MKGLFIILAVFVAVSLVSYQSASASTWTGSPFDGKLTPQTVNKSTTGLKGASWMKHYGSANSPVCGVTICDNISPLQFSFDGNYVLNNFARR